MRIRIIWGAMALLACAPERAADDPVTRAGIEAALSPPARQPLDLRPELPRGTQRVTVVRARLLHGDAEVASIRELRTAVVDADGNTRLDVWTLADGAAVVEDGRTCLIVDGAFYSGWRTRPPQRLRPQTRPERCITADPLAEMAARFAGELAVVPSDSRVAFRLRARDRLAPNPIPLTWPEGRDRQVLGAPRGLYLVEHARPRRFEGHLQTDAAGHLLGGALDARFAVRKDGRDAVLHLTIRGWSRPFAGRLEAPAVHTVETPRERIVPRIEAVLGTLPADPTPLPGPGDAPPLKLPGEPHGSPTSTPP